MKELEGDRGLSLGGSLQMVKVRLSPPRPLGPLRMFEKVLQFVTVTFKREFLDLFCSVEVHGLTHCEG